MAGGYAELLRARHAMRLLCGTLTGRLPNACATLAVLLFTRAHGGGYGLAGALSAVYGLGTAVGQPLLGRLVDRRGQPAVMLGGAVASGVAAAAFALTGLRPAWLAALLITLSGLATPPLEGGLRALWPSVLARTDGAAAGPGAPAGPAAGAPSAVTGAVAGVPGPAAAAPAPGADPGGPDAVLDGRLQAAYAMDAAAQEVMFVVGPLLVTLAVAEWSTAGAILALAVVGVAGALVVVTAPPSRRWRAPERAAHWLGPLRSRGIVVLLAAFLCVGAALGAIAVAAVAYGDRHGGGPVASVLLSALGFGALVGGLGYGARRWAGPAQRRLLALTGCLALAYLPLALVPGVAAMTALAAFAGLFLAPTMACAFVVVDRLAPAGTVTEAFSWLVTAFGVGSSAGSALAGPAAQYGGPATGFAVAGAGGLAGALVLLAGRRFIGVSNLRRRMENDRIGAPEPGFSGTHRA